MHTTRRTQEGISRFFGEKNGQVLRCFTCVDAMKGHKEKIHRQSPPTATNFLTGLLIGLGGFQSGTQSGTVGGEV